MKLISKTFFLFLPILAAFSGILLRMVETINKNYVFGFDHGREYLMVREIVENHNLRLIGTPLGAGSAGIQGIFHGPGYYYFLAIPYILFQGDPYGGVVLMLAFGLAALIAMFFLSYKIFGIKGAILASSLLAISPPIIAQSRFIWSPYPSTFFVLLAFIFTYYQKKNLTMCFLAAFFSAFVYNFELAIAVPLSLTLIIYSVFVLKIRNIREYVALAFGFLVALSPMVLFEVRNQFQAFRGLIAYLSGSGGVNTNSKIGFFENLFDHVKSFIYNFSGTFPDSLLVLPIVLFIIILVLLVINYRKETHIVVKNFLLYLCLLTVVTFIVLAFLRNTVYAYYLYHINVVYILLLTFGFSKVLGTKSLLKFMAIGITATILLTGTINNIKTFTKDIGDYGGDAKIKGKIDAFDYIYKDANGEKFNLLVFSPPVYTYPYDYIAQWYGQKKYGYIPGDEKKGVLYLLIEKDSSKPWSYRGWLETVIKVGRVEKEVVLPSGFIIQRRVVK